ncbi:hypothetical protein [Microbacterium gubbeenense]|uniref:hypothetical protein n=1 Tax=Microbacterium gubbeenense TaxID=159896 RepID=UPI0012F7C8F3|nr:hypothetical protein [Microbacterium gubbeenense]
MSISLTLTSVVGNAIELNTVAEVGRLIGRDARPSRGSLRKYQSKVLKFALPVTLSVGMVLAIIYGVGVGDAVFFGQVVCVVMIAPLLSGYTSVRSGVLIAEGYATWAIGFQSLRSLVPLVGIVLFPHLSALFLAVFFVLGEIFRAVAITLRLRVVPVRPEVNVNLPVTGLWWQALSSGISQGSRVVDRSFLAPVVGGISNYELADKAFFAVVQFLTLGVLTPRVATWAGLPSMKVCDGKKMLRRDLTLLLGGASALGGLEIVALLFISRSAWMPAEWATGAQWAIILAFALPFNIGVVASGRLLIIARRQKWLLWTSTTTLAANAVLDYFFFQIWGGLGIPVATLFSQALSFLLYGLLVARALPPVMGAERSAP